MKGQRQGVLLNRYTFIIREALSYLSWGAANVTLFLFFIFFLRVLYFPSSVATRASG